MNQDDLTTIVKDNLNPDANRCVKCGRTFSNAQGLNMHKIRMHSSKGWDTSNNFRGRNHGRKHQSEEERLRKRRQYQKNLRERYYREGKNSRGEPMPAGYTPKRKKRTAPSSSPEAKREYYLRSKNRYKAMGLNARGAPLRNNAQSTSTISLTPDMTGEAAKAIMVAASVIRAVTTGMKISQ